MQEHSCSISDSLKNFCIVVGCTKNHSITNKHCFSDTKSLSDNILQRRYILILHECTNRTVVRCSFQKESVTWIAWGRVICTSSRDPLNQLQMVKEKGRLDRYTMAPSSSSGTLLSTLSSCINCCWKYNVCWSTGTSNFWRMVAFKSATVSSYIELNYRMYARKYRSMMNWLSPQRWQSVAERPQRYKASTTPWDHVY